MFIPKKIIEIKSLVLVPLTFAIFLVSFSAAAEEVVIGLRVIRGVELGLKQWQATADYLSERIDGYSFRLEPYDKLNELSAAAENGELDYVITNPSSYVEMEISSGASRVLTLINKRQGKPFTQFGSVIFSRADRTDIMSFEDLRGKTLIAVSEPAFGGWRVAWGELLKHGVVPGKDLKEILFAGGNQQNVVFAVRDGKADVGVVRTDMLERMDESGHIDLNNFRNIGQHDSKDFPFLRSTELYPEWAFAKFPKASRDLSRKIVHELLELTPDSKAALDGKYIGWTVPLNYQPVHDLLRTLKVGPYKDYGKVTLSDTLHTYRYWIITTIVILIILFTTGSFALTRNRQLAQLRAGMLADSERELNFQRLALDEHAIVSIADINGNITHVNDKFCQISGYSREELLGHNHRILKSDEHSPEFYNELWRTISSGKPWHGEVKNLKKAGGHYWVKATIVPFLDKQGKPFQYVGIRTDISEQKESEDILKKHSKSVELMHGVMAAATLYTEPALVLQSILDYICEFMDWPVAHIYFLSDTDSDTLVPSEIWHFSDDDAFTPFHAATMDTQFSRGIGLPGRVLENGEPSWIKDVTTDPNFPRAQSAKSVGLKTGLAFPVKIDGKTKAVLEFFSTETMEADTNILQTIEQVSEQIGRAIERKEAEEQVRESEERYRQIADVSSDWVWEMDKDFRLSYLSTGFERVTGLDPAFSLGKTRDELTSDDLSSEHWRRHLADLEAHREFRNFRYGFTRQDGWKMQHSISGSPVFDSEGEFDGYRGTASDVTDLYQARNELEVARDEAVMANRAKSDFLSSMSHELRTPLNAILGFGQMLDFNPKEPLTKAQKSSVGHILKGGSHLLDLINDVLDLAKIEAGKVDLSIEKVRFSDVIKECLTLVGEMAENRSIDISIPDGAENGPVVLADFTRLKQVLLNLLSNAIKYNRDGGSVRVACDETADGMLKVSVSDNGDGIPHDKQGELFQAFSRLGAENSEIEGTGIGLVVSKELVEMMGGRIGFTSEQGKGSTFFFELPLSASENDAVGPSKTGDDAEETLQTINGIMLYVEDNPSNLHLMETIVSYIDGLTMLSAHNAELGIEIAKNKQPDIIILDINLPGMDGFEALKVLKAQAETRDIPVLALSAAATRSDIEKGLAAGFLHYLTKPLQVLEVTEAIKGVIESRN